MANTEIINDLTPEQLREAIEPKPVIVGNEEEIENIKKVFDSELLTPDEDLPETPAHKDAATPRRKEPPAPSADALEIDGQQVPLDKVKNAFKFWSATNQRAAQVAEERRRVAEERAQFERDRKAAEDRINQILDERLPPPVPKEPEPIQVNLTAIGPRPTAPDISTLEGQERYAEYERQRDDWEQKRLALIMQADREKPAPTPIPKDAATPPRETPATEPVVETVFQHNVNIGGQFKAPMVLAEIGIDEAKAQNYLERIDREFSPASQDGRWTLNEVRILVRRFQEMEQDDARKAAEAIASQRTGAIKNAANASDVVRGGGAPAQRSLKVGDVLSMSVEDLRRRVVGPMKGRGGSQAHGLDPLYKTWQKVEEIS